MRFEVKIEGFEKTLAALAGKGKQVRFAAAVALTRTAGDIKSAIPAALDQALDRPTTFTKNGTFVSRADRNSLQAIVGFKDRQAAYMKYQIAGGQRNPGPGGLRLPGAIQLNDFGNIPRGLISKMIAVARKEGSLTRRIARRVRVSQNVELFFGDPTDHGGKHMPRGIYKDVDLGKGRKQLIPLIVFPQRPAMYKKRFDFPALANRVIQANWKRNFDVALAEALRTAR